MAIGPDFTCLVRTSGAVECRGNNEHGELGTPPPGRHIEGRTIAWAG